MDELIRTCPACLERTAVELGQDADVRVFSCGLCQHEFDEVDLLRDRRDGLP